MTVDIDPDLTERWRSYRYRKLMGITVAEYDDTPALTVDWDLELRRVETEAERELQEQERRRSGG